MNEDTLDPGRERLVAYLYNELSDEEAGEVRRQLETDAELRAELDELQEARVLLREAEQQEAAPEFVFLTPEVPAFPAPAPTGRGFWRRWSSPTWGFAAAAAGLAILVLAGLRVDRVDSGFALRFGTPAPTSTFNASDPAATPISGTPPASMLPVPPEGYARQVAATQPYVTETQLQSYTVAMMEAMAVLLEQKDRQQRQELSLALRSMYGQLADEESRRYEDIRTSIEGVGLGLLAEQSRTSARLDAFLEQTGSLPNPDAQPASSLPREDDKP